MNVAVLLMTDKVVRLKGNSYEILDAKYTITGRLSKFKIKDVEYSFTDKYKIDKKQIIGYCKKEILEKVVNKEITSSTTFLNPENWFDKTFAPAQVGDIFHIKTLDFKNHSNQYDFEYYYRLIEYKFRIKDTAPTIFVKTSNYPTIVDNNIDSLNYFEKIIFDNNHNNSIEGKFYKKNFGDKVTSLPLSNDEKEVLATYMVYICLNMYWIRKEELLDVISIYDSSINGCIIDKYVNNNLLGLYDDLLTFVDKLVGEINKDWGVYNNYLGTGLTSPILEPKDLFPILDIKVLSKFNSALNNFYSEMHLIKEETIFPKDASGNPLNDAGKPLTTDPSMRVEKDSDRRIIKLLNLLSSISFSLFSPQERLKLLDKALDYKEIYEDRSKVKTTQDYIIEGVSNAFLPGSGSVYSASLPEDTSIFIEEDIIKLVASFNTTYDEANLLLDFLLQTKGFDGDASITKYERLYNLINDKGAGRVAIVNWFVSEENNRAKLILTLYEIWQKSKYFFYSQPPGVVMTENGTNPQNYFLFTPEGNAYYADYNEVTGEVLPGTGSEPLLEFQSVDLKYGFKYLVKYIPEKIEKEKVIVTKKLIIENFASDWIPDALEWGHQIFEPEPFGSYHLYQTISLVGFKVDEDLATQVPQINLGLVPAFLFHYVEEFDRLKNVYAGISLAIEITLEVGLFFATAGSSSALALRHLRHLRHFTKLGKIKTVTGTLEAGVAASDVLFSFRVAEGAAEITSMTAGVASSYLSYLADVNDNAFQRRLSYFFMAFALASAGGAIYSNRKVVKMADDILNPNLTPTTLLNHLQSTKPAVYNLLLEVAGKKVAFLTDFATRIENFTEVKNFFNNTLVGALADLRPKFLEDFGALDPTVLQKLNNPGVLNNWKKLANVDAVYERKLFDFISNTNRTDTLVLFYGNNPLKLKIQVLDDAKKITFVDTFKDPPIEMINKFLEKPEAITRWTNNAQSRLLAKTEPEIWLYIANDLPIGTTYSKVQGSPNWQLLDPTGFPHFRGALSGPPPFNNFEDLIKFKKLPNAEQQVIINEVNNAINVGPYRYTNVITYQGIPILRSRDGLGVSPDFKNLGMAFDPPGSNILGNGITDIPGLTEPLSNIIQKIKNFPEGIKVPLTNGDRKIEYVTMWKKMGINPEDGAKIKFELELEIHHVDDLNINLETTLQLVTKEAHKAAGDHTGSVAQIKKLFQIINNLP